MSIIDKVALAVYGALKALKFIGIGIVMIPFVCAALSPVIMSISAAESFIAGDPASGWAFVFVGALSLIVAPMIVCFALDLASSRSILAAEISNRYRLSFRRFVDRVASHQRKPLAYAAMDEKSGAVQAIGDNGGDALYKVKYHPDHERNLDHKTIPLWNEKDIRRAKENMGRNWKPEA